MTRYLLSTWESVRDEIPMVHMDCMRCHGLCGQYDDDTLVVVSSHGETWHAQCAPLSARVLAGVNLIVRTFRAVLGIDSRR